MLNTRLSLPLVLAIAATLAACSSGEDPASLSSTAAPSPAAVSSSAAADETPSASPSPSATADDARPTEPPAQSVDAGTVADGTAGSAAGEGSAEITFVREGDLAVVVALDCSACSGPTVLTAPERMSPLDESDGAMEGSYLVDVFEDTAPEQSLWLVAEGKWTVELLSWNDLPPTEGAIEGTGSTVMFLVDESASSTVTWTPAGEGDSFQGRFFGVTREDARTFGDSVAFTDEIDMQRPGVLSISTDGDWSIEP